MKSQASLGNRQSFRRRAGAFSLVEVVIALAISVFVLISMLGLLSEGLSVGQDSRQQMQAADLAALIVSARRASPINATISQPTGNVLLPPLNQALPATPVTTWINFAGQTTTQANAAFRVSYQVGTNATAPGVGLISLRLTWPPGANPSVAKDQYEMTTQVLMAQ
jgi:Tfp pilus assembly protein PilV